jgi:uncharacterized protein YutE (UPF0331/DUF86 family)
MELKREIIRKRFEDIREALDRLERIRALSKVYEILQTGLDDLRLFVKAVKDSLLENPWGKNES